MQATAAEPFATYRARAPRGLQNSSTSRRSWTIRGLVLGGLSPDRGRRAIQALARFPIERISHRGFLERMWELRDNLTAYDAAYVALAERLDTSLVTGDIRLAGARRHPMLYVPRSSAWGAF